jgi:membrane protein
VGFMFLATMLANVATTAVIGRFADLVPLPSLVLRVGSVVFSLLVVVFFIAIIFRVLPNKRTPWPDVLLGAALTAVLFAIGNYAIGIYLGRAGFGSVFGAAGALAVIIFWMYYTAQIILFGAELTRAHHERKVSGRPSL